MIRALLRASDTIRSWSAWPGPASGFSKVAQPVIKARHGKVRKESIPDASDAGCKPEGRESHPGCRAQLRRVETLLRGLAAERVHRRTNGKNGQRRNKP